MAQDFCRKCGNTVQPKDRFCRKCGSPLDPTDASIKHSPPNKSVNWLRIGVLVGLLPSLFFFLTLLLGIYSLGDAIFYGLYFGFGGIPGGVLGAFLGKRGIGLAVGGAVTGTTLGYFL